MIWVTEVKALPNYRLWLRFSDGSQGNVDLKEFIFADARPVVSALRDPALFAAVQVEMDTAVWRNGFDLAPEFLHARVRVGASALARPRNTLSSYPRHATIWPWFRAEMYSSACDSKSDRSSGYFSSIISLKRVARPRFVPVGSSTHAMQ